MQRSGVEDLVSSVSFCFPPSSPFFPTSGNPVLSYGLPEPWLVGDDAFDKSLQGDTEWAVCGVQSAGSELSDKSPAPAAEPDRAATTTTKPGRKPGPARSSDGSIVSHVEAERQRREKLKRRFCDLRAAVPMVSRMDKASLLADAAAYIAQLRGRVEQLEAEAAARKAAPLAAFGLQEKLEVRMVGREAAALRLTTTAAEAPARHAPARLMGALRSLDMPVQHACVSSVGVGGAAATVQDAVVDVPAALQDEGCLRAALLHALQQQDDG
ncbi:hypothetical protein ACP4OV_005338 [Aristida adscensionis]